VPVGSLISHRDFSLLPLSQGHVCVEMFRVREPSIRLMRKVPERFYFIFAVLLWHENCAPPEKNPESSGPLEHLPSILWDRSRAARSTFQYDGKSFSKTPLRNG
jgi:hypothetical protein